MLQYRTNAGERRKPALGQYGELTVEQARSLAQEWLAQVRRGGDPAADKAAARTAPTVKELCTKFMEDYSKLRTKRSAEHTSELQSLMRHPYAVCFLKKKKLYDTDT